MIHKLDSHTHTLASGHAYNTIMEMAKAAVDQKLELLAVTDHAMAMPGTCHSFYFMNLRSLPRSMYGIEVLFGSEVNIMNYDGKLDMSQGLLEQMDVVVASMHTPCLKPGSIEEVTKGYLKAIENPFVNIIGHPDDARYPVDFELVVPAAKEHHVLLELNNSSLHPTDGRPNAIENCRDLLERCMHYGTSIVLDSDAHIAEDAGNHRRAHKLLQELNFPEELVVNTSIEKLAAYIPAVLEQDEPEE